MGYLSVHVKEGVATIALLNPPANAMSSHVFAELLPLLELLEGDAGIRVILVHGEGKFFSAGADIKEFTSIQSAEDAKYLATRGQQLFEKVENFSKPIIAVIHGAALGGGLEFAMSCHMRLVSKEAKLGLPELNLGLIPGFAGTQRLSRYVGSSKALEMMLTSEPINGEKAVQLGLANQAYEEDELFEQAAILAKKIAQKSPATIKAVLELAYTKKDASFYAGVEREAQLFGEVFQAEDAKEGIAAFIEKRKAIFTGK